MRPRYTDRNRIQTELPLVFYFIFPVKWTKIRVFQFPILLFNEKKDMENARGLLCSPHSVLNVTMRRIKKKKFPRYLRFVKITAIKYY